MADPQEDKLDSSPHVCSVEGNLIFGTAARERASERGQNQAALFWPLGPSPPKLCLSPAGHTRGRTGPTAAPEQKVWPMQTLEMQKREAALGL